MLRRARRSLINSAKMRAHPGLKPLNIQKFGAPPPFHSRFRPQIQEPDRNLSIITERK
jgi:hypothetical protein